VDRRRSSGMMSQLVKGRLAIVQHKDGHFSGPSVCLSPSAKAQRWRDDARPKGEEEVP
jgi:hypothetical protein